MLVLVLSLALAGPVPMPAQPAAPTAMVEGKRRVLVLDLKAEGVDDATTRTLTAIVANAFAGHAGYSVTSGADMRATLDVEASKQAAECAEDSCMADLAGALGAELIVSGSVGKLGDLLVVTVSLYDAVVQASVAKKKVEDRNLAELSPKLDTAVAQMLGARRESSLLVPAVVVLSASALVAVAGGVVSGVAFAKQEDPLSTGQQKDEATLAYPLGLAALGLGAAGVVLGGVLLGFAIME